MSLEYSIVVPIFNESQNLAQLLAELQSANAEIVIVDDGSSDLSPGQIEGLARQYSTLQFVRHSRNLGQSSAVLTGVLSAKSDKIVTMDGDLQNNPLDIVRLIRELEHGVDLVYGIRTVREDSWIRRLSSQLANRFRNYVLHDGCADSACGLKAFRKSSFLTLPLFDHFHRFLPALFLLRGYSVRGIPVDHRPRVHGVSKYSTLHRLRVGLIDLAGVYWLQHRQLSAWNRKHEE